MNLRVYSVYDLKAKIFMQPFFSHNVATAGRMFSDTVNDSSTMLHKHPEDYCLYEIGGFDDETGELFGSPQAQNLGLAAKFLNVEQ